MKLSLIIFGVVIVVLAGGLLFLSHWDIPAPIKHVEKVIPNEMLSD